MVHVMLRLTAVVLVLVSTTCASCWAGALEGDCPRPVRATSMLQLTKHSWLPALGLPAMNTEARLPAHFGAAAKSDPAENVTVDPVANASGLDALGNATSDPVENATSFDTPKAEKLRNVTVDPVANAIGLDALGDATSDPVENATSLDTPTAEKLRNLARAAIALETSQMSGRDLEETLKVVNAAFGVLKDANSGVHIDADRAEYLEEHLGDQSAESAAANDVLLTATDIAEEADGMRGEDFGIGPADEFYPNNTYQGDMIPVDTEQLLLFQAIAAGRQPKIAAGRSWTGGKVYYCFASDISPRSKALFVASTRQYSRAVPCLEFQDVGWKSGRSEDARSDQACQVSPAVFVISRPSAGCYSYVGMIPFFQSQQLQLNDPGCLSIGTAVHELGHALGMAHEQSRPDRDKYVRVMYENIDPIHEHDFNIEPSAFTGLPYDFLSVMQYDAFAFAHDPKKPTLVRADGSGHANLGNRIGLSYNDVMQVSAMYEPENPQCKGLKPNGMGCVDTPNDSGVNDCSTATACSAPLIKRCCGCGGGVKVQCFEGSPCPKPPELPAPESKDCIHDKTHLSPGWKEQYKCIFTNACSFSVTWKCPSNACVHTTTPGGLWVMSCNGKTETEICSPGVCTVAKAE